MMRYPRDVHYLDDDFKDQEGVALERNGSLTLVEKHDGTVDWVSNFQLED